MTSINSDKTRSTDEDQQPAGREMFRKQFLKTRPCLFYLDKKCKRGDKCTFAHGEVEDAPNLDKTSICRQWKKGLCTLSSTQCRFAHGRRDLRRTALFQQIPTDSQHLCDQPTAPPAPPGMVVSSYTTPPVSHRQDTNSTSQPLFAACHSVAKVNLEPMKVVPLYVGESLVEHLKRAQPMIAIS